MIYGFAYLFMVLGITFIWLFLAKIKNQILQNNIIIIKTNLKAFILGFLRKRLDDNI